MKNTLIASFVALVSAGVVAGAQEVTATGPQLGGSIGIEVNENAAGDYAAETTLGFGVSAATGAGLAFGGFTFESVDEGSLTVDEWQLGLGMDLATVTIGDQGDIFVGNDFEIVGGDTLADPANNDSLIIDADIASVFIGFDDITADVTEVDNVQVSTTLGITTGVVDHNFDTEETTLGAKATGDLGDVSVTSIATYAVDAEDFGYEAAVSYGDVTAFVNGDDEDAAQNIGAGYNTDFDNLNVYVEGAYNIDAEETTIGGGGALKF